jgi:formate dehydrogenase major subunit
VLQFKPDTDVALLNAMMHVIVDRGPGRRGASSPRAPTSRRWRPTCAAYSPEAMAPICGIDAETLREVARLYATAARR